MKQRSTNCWACRNTSKKLLILFMTSTDNVMSSILEYSLWLETNSLCGCCNSSNNSSFVNVTHLQRREWPSLHSSRASIHSSTKTAIVLFKHLLSDWINSMVEMYSVACENCIPMDELGWRCNVFFPAHAEMGHISPFVMIEHLEITFFKVAWWCLRNSENFFNCFSPKITNNKIMIFRKIKTLYFRVPCSSSDILVYLLLNNTWSRTIIFNDEFFRLLVEWQLKCVSDVIFYSIEDVTIQP